MATKHMEIIWILLVNLAHQHVHFQDMQNGLETAALFTLNIVHIEIKRAILVEKKDLSQMVWSWSRISFKIDFKL